MTSPPANRPGASDADPQSGPLLPDFCSIPMVAAVVIYAQLLALLIALISPRPLTELWEGLGPLSLYVQLIAFLSASLLCLLRRTLPNIPRRWMAFIAWLAIVASTMLVTLATVLATPWQLGHDFFPSDGPEGLMLRALFVSGLVGALLLRYLYLHGEWRRQVEAVADARFQKLQARIRPHFLFNSMNTIANLTATNPQLAEEVVMDLADLFRASLAKDETVTTLSQELDLARRYLNIEGQRLGSRMKVDWDVDDVPMDAKLPPLLLQPLVENAVYHGIQPSRSPGRIQIVGLYRRGMVNLSVRNTLPNSTEQRQDHHKGNRIAMENVRQRLEAMFPGLGRVIVSRVEGDYQVRLVFPHPWRTQ